MRACVRACVGARSLGPFAGACPRCAFVASRLQTAWGCIPECGCWRSGPLSFRASACCWVLAA
eukprot:12320999-Alexandrium_andersonii.AAC.1